MTIITSAPAATHNHPVALVRGLLSSCVCGAGLAAFAVGAILENVPLIIGSLVGPVVYGVLNVIAGAPTKARLAAVVPVTALARIESLEATGAELSADVPINFELTVAPDEGPAFRLRMRDSVNLVDVQKYRPGDIVIVAFPPDRPWKAKLVTKATPEWRDRVSDAAFDSAPAATLMREPPEGTAYKVTLVVGVLLGVALILTAYRADLMDKINDSDSTTTTSTTTSSTTSTSSSTVVSSGSGTVVLGSGQSFLDKGELRKAVESLTKGDNRGEALTVSVQDSMLSVVFPPSGAQLPVFDPDSLPYDRVPALVKEARATLGVRSPKSWQLTAESLTGSLSLRIGVTGADGDTASLVADGKGKVVQRNPAAG
ncbi:hypothetical protein [Streptomyces geranii]|uniref:hypothetical protein n=1 Tax=Streptomyces geranii TaxID=2058923 RepID=UPI000D044347|nr:hypothetical protein [Streptomyces geranii]